MYMLNIPVWTEAVYYPDPPEYPEDDDIYDDRYDDGNDYDDYPDNDDDQRDALLDDDDIPTTDVPILRPSDFEANTPHVDENETVYVILLRARVNQLESFVEELKSSNMELKKEIMRLKDTGYFPPEQNNTKNQRHIIINDEWGDNMKKRTDKEWYDLAGKQNYDTLPAFIKEVQAAFPGYEGLVEPKEWTDEAREALYKEGQKRYVNGIIAGILISLAAFHATSNTYGYSCNQAGVVRNAFYKAVFDEKIPFKNI